MEEEERKLLSPSLVALNFASSAAELNWVRIRLGGGPPPGPAAGAEQRELLRRSPDRPSSEFC